ncbi:class I SAM-dependent methyltransferase [Agrobacterium leguminum]|uniref:class I SAM-dependent methyltransferase n=1 Tax=Agrobacterium TaxID=357 RepID=UPI0009B98F09|nr:MULTISPECIES: class I SAM-dependent methyltransferase [Agrobacterium]WFS69104.1 class I SAM-dependent methyltransferase [Agrobacterium leguminum]
MADTFYLDFEARFRGDPAVIRERLRVYEAFLRPLAAQSDARLLDLGCGRGEWLELAGDVGLDARGVDLDENMLSAARKRGLAVENMDCLEALRAVPDGTLAVVSAFHLIEHISFDDLRELIANARRVLRPGGIMILETPNPENLIVGLVNFHLDPTHRKPLPPLLTSFLAEHTGFFRNIILRLQGAERRAETEINFESVLTTVSLDYAVVAQVAGPLAHELDSAFELRLGLDLLGGVRRFDAAFAAQTDALKATSSALVVQTENLNSEVSDLRCEADALKATSSALVVQTENLNSEVSDLRCEADALRDEIATFRREITTALSEKTGALEAGASHLRSAVTALQTRINEPAYARLLLHSSGMPRRAVRRLLFHANGKPRGMFRSWVLKSDNRPHRVFRRWMDSPQYQSMPWPSRQQSPQDSANLVALESPSIALTAPIERENDPQSKVAKPQKDFDVDCIAKNYDGKGIGVDQKNYGDVVFRNASLTYDKARMFIGMYGEKR